MNAAHLHLILNHFPVVGSLFALGFFVASAFYRTKVLQQIALKPAKPVAYQIRIYDANH